MGPSEVRALPWWHKRLLIEGLEEEFGDPDADEVIDASSPEGLAAAAADFGITVGTA